MSLPTRLFQPRCQTGTIGIRFAGVTKKQINVSDGLPVERRLGSTWMNIGDVWKSFCVYLNDHFAVRSEERAPPGPRLIFRQTFSIFCCIEDASDHVAGQ